MTVSQHRMEIVPRTYSIIHISDCPDGVLERITKFFDLDLQARVALYHSPERSYQEALAWAFDSFLADNVSFIGASGTVIKSPDSSDEEVSVHPDSDEEEVSSEEDPSVKRETIENGVVWNTEDEADAGDVMITPEEPERSSECVGRRPLSPPDTSSDESNPDASELQRAGQM